MSQTQFKNQILGTVVKRLGSNIKEFKYKGEPLISRVPLEYHRVYQVSRDNRSINNQFPMIEVNKIDHRFRFELVYHDLKRRCNRRNITLTDSSDILPYKTYKPFLLIVKLAEPKFDEYFEDESDPNSKSVNNQNDIDNFRKGVEREYKWILKYMCPTMYSDVKQAELDPSLITEKKELSDRVHVPVRSSHEDTKTLTYIKSEEQFRDDENFIYFRLEKMGDIKWDYVISDRERLKILAFILGKTPIVISDAKIKYFKDESKHIQYSDELFYVETSKPNVLAIFNDIYNSKSLYSLYKSREYQNMQRNFPEFIPRKYANKIDVDMHKSMNNLKLDYIKGIKDVDYHEDFLRLINRDFLQKYPLVDGLVDLSRYSLNLSDMVISSIMEYIYMKDKQSLEKSKRKGLVKCVSKVSALVKKRRDIVGIS